MRKKSLLFASALLLSLASCGGQSSSSGGGSGGDDAEYYVVTFEFNDSSSRPYKKEVEKGTSIDAAPLPEREGYEFLGWYRSLDGNEEVAFPYTVTANATLYAHWDAAKFDVTFDLNYEGAPAASVQEVAYNQTVSAPAESPLRDGFVFRYWTMDAEGSEQAVFPYLVKKDVTFYASWRADDVKVFTVTVHYGDYDGAPEDLKLEVEEGEPVTRAMVTEPDARSGYDFKGWSFTDGGELITLPFTPTEDTDLYAVWERKSYSLTFYSNYVDAPKEKYYETTYYGGDDIAAPTTDPTRDGYTFKGWYTANKGGNKVTFPTTGYRNLSYYAQWESLAKVTDTFHAEYCYFDPNANYPGYSGAAKGDQCVIRTNAEGVLVDGYPTNSTLAAGNGYAVSFQYSNNAIIRFEIEASEDISGAKFLINWSSEFDETYGPVSQKDGDDYLVVGYEIRVNGKAINYPETSLICAVDGNGQPVVEPGPFSLTELGTVDLVKGTNVIELQPNNDRVHGTMTATAPVTDYIKFEYAGSGALSWKPIYDNINSK